MRIAQLAPLVESVPPAGYGGSEAVVSWLTDELVRLGHEVTLYASEASSTSARLVATGKPLRRDSGIPPYHWQATELESLLKLQDEWRKFDLIHNHMGYQALSFLARFDCASVSTNHNPIEPYIQPIYRRFNYLPYVAISNSYRQLNLPDQLNYVSTIHHGIDLAPYDKVKGPAEYLLFIGRISAHKGTAIALDIAHQLELPIKLAGKVDEQDQSYFEQEVKPRLAQPHAHYVGEATVKEKAELLRCAIALLHPIQFDEPFGLVLAEALASGTPVLAFDRGSIREVIADGETGIVAQNADELVNRFEEIGNISSEACRRRARLLFTKERMARDYERLFENLVKIQHSKAS